MEPRFSHDFSNVRIHTDHQAAESTRTVNALAYTVGADVVFGAGQYSPGTSRGDWLLAHELTHVVQQRDASLHKHPNEVIDSDTGGALEHEADAQATRVVSGRPIAPMSIQGRLGVARLQRLDGPCPDIPSSHRLLIRGSVHPAVREAQRKINLFHAAEVAAGRPGVVDAPLVEDCVFGQHTFNAVLSFQSQRFPGLPAEHDGKFGDHTWAELDAASTPVPVVPPPVLPPPPVGCTLPTNPDMSGTAFNPTTDGENAVIARHPIDAFRVNTARNEAFRLSGTSGLAGPHLGPQDAFRHCVWNCLMTQSIGTVNAEQFATGHENSGPSSIPFDNVMDLHDNAVGRSLGTPGADPATVCMTAVTTGQLRTIRGPHTSPQAVPPVTTSCIGASNQVWP